MTPSRPWSRRIAAALLVLVVASAVACRREPTHEGDPTGAVPVSNDLPALELRDETPDLLLTWVDEKGDFHVVQRTADVPDKGRDQVRVVITTKPEGTEQRVYVANLTRKNPDGTYPVSQLSRAQWDAVGADRRAARLEALAPASAAPSASAAASAAPAVQRPTRKVSAIVYGASWCKPCHDAARYLRQRGVNVVEKDIESGDAVEQELNTKLERAHMSGAKIPIIDIGGRLLVGFSPQALDKAVDAVASAKPL